MNENNVILDTNLSKEEVGLTKSKSPVWLGMKFFFADVGISAAVGFVTGMILAAAHFDVKQIVLHGRGMVVAIFIGLFVSLCISFVLRQQYSNNRKALIYLIFAGATYSIIIFCTQLILETENLSKVLIAGIAQVIVYLIGWGVASRTKFNLFSVPSGLITAFFAVGIVTVFLSTLGLVSIITGTNKEVRTDESTLLADQVFSFYQDQAIIEFPFQTNKNNPNLSDPQNFDTPESINRALSFIQGTITELETHKERLGRIFEGVQKIVDASDLKQAAKKELVEELRAYIEGPWPQELADSFREKTKEIFVNYASLYEFMLEHYNEYSLPYVDSGKHRQVVFNSQEYESKFYELISNVDTSVLSLQVARITYDKYVQDGSGNKTLPIPQ
ncbi:MAG: hypothetical protein RJA61_208 [Candidatus Parcubacteria bacterium]|jgi:hypothetical protein